MSSETALADVEAVTKRLDKVNIRGKQYVTVDQRVRGYWSIVGYDEGRIETAIDFPGAVAGDFSFCTCKATVYFMGEPITTGYACEREGASNINKTSFVENCETSAVGRALGFMGIGVVDGIASADELAHAISQQEEAAETPAKRAVAPQEPRKEAGRTNTHPGRFGRISALKKQAQEKGITDEVMRFNLEQAVPGKSMRDYNDEEIGIAENVLQNLIEQA